MTHREKVNHVREAVLSYLRTNHVTGDMKEACEEFVADSHAHLSELDVAAKDQPAEVELPVEQPVEVEVQAADLPKKSKGGK